MWCLSLAGNRYYWTGGKFETYGQDAAGKDLRREVVVAGESIPDASERYKKAMRIVSKVESVGVKFADAWPEAVRQVIGRLPVCIAAQAR